MKYLLFFTLTITNTIGYAQNNQLFGFESISGVSFSIPNQKYVDLGIVDASPDGADKTNYYSKSNIFYELNFNYLLSSSEELSLGINYNTYSLKVKDISAYSTQKGSIETKYINIPFLYSKGYSDSSNFSISFGAYIGFLMEVNEVGTSYTDEDIIRLNPNDPRFIAKRDYYNSIKSDYRSTDFGLILQQNYHKKLNQNLSIKIFARFNIGLQNTISSDIFDRNAEYSAADKWHNHYFSLGAGLKFR